MASPSEATPRCVYEVSVSIPVEDDASYAAYMKTNHIPAIMATGKFHDITMTSSLDSLLGGAAEPQWVHYKTNYVAHSAAALQSYLADDAPGLRADFMLHCPKDAKVSRRVWSVQQHWDQ